MKCQRCETTEGYFFKGITKQSASYAVFLRVLRNRRSAGAGLCASRSARGDSAGVDSDTKGNSACS